jgi:hypothetical protein
VPRRIIDRGMGSFGLGSLAGSRLTGRFARPPFFANREVALRWLGVGPGQQI